MLLKHKPIFFLFSTHLTRYLLFVLLVFAETLLFSQNIITLNKISLSYVFSTLNTGGIYKYNYNSSIYKGYGAFGTFKLCDTLYIETGITIKKEGAIKEDGYWDFYGKQIFFSHEYTYRYTDIPFSFHYNFYCWKSLHLSANSGIKVTFFSYQDKWRPYLNGIEYDEQCKAFGLAYFVGLMQSIRITNRISVLFSQNIGEYLYYKKDDGMHYLSNIEYVARTIDIKGGISFYLHPSSHR
jgi:hypothetical protein